MITNDQRAIAYAVLSRFFADVLNLEDIERLSAAIADNGLPAAGSLLSALEESQEPSLLEDAQREFTSLFLLRGGVKPYESAYISESHLLMQEPWVSVREFYRALGVKLDDTETHVEDHLSVELAFVSHLVNEGLVAEQRSFMKEHLGRWVFDVLNAIDEHPKAKLYRKIGQFALTFLRMEYDYLLEEH